MILLDTHVLLWWQAGGERLSKRVTREIEKAGPILVSPISFWEVAVLVEKGRVTLDRDIFVWTSDFLSAEDVDVAPLTPSAAIGAGLLPKQGFGGDPADCMLYATAREQAVPLITKDMEIRTYAARKKDLRVIW